jgi:hypothetical protein
MFKKHLLKISLLLPLVAISAAAHAGSAISDKRHWPSEAKPTAYGVTASQNNPRSAFASSVMTPRFEAAPMANEGGNVRRYHGGPKSPW